ncbi:sigma-70 family RNA polymerase sigma factor [Phytoactinopolyspora alkaliphila]|uniref:Sigma-70 family RNA polymerase sigma factor n=1 Tax=Phytoactinopolyspora alkaliphila TaxID=1783498 RepID=A0A6N9YQR2_9ACTN|nr:sigma-70 family RNA polymerase sigma factor [Phytoactinopolyspora alkaliphila]NED97322.1 sigma-70 family RNA polymerase sigma factor [Phytoactinopolyspora alkaliphila]
MRVWVEDQGLPELLAGARNGDELAFTSLYRKVAPAARRTAQRIVQDAHAAEDLVQEAFYLVLRAFRTGHGPTDSFAAYVQSTVKRLAYRHFAKQGRTVVTDSDAVWERYLAPVIPPTAQADLVVAAWASLPARWRRILWLIEVDRYTPAELAPGMAMTPNAVSSLATRARRALCAAYQEMQEAEGETLAQAS